MLFKYLKGFNELKISRSNSQIPCQSNVVFFYKNDIHGITFFQMTVSDHVRVVLDQVQTKLTGTYLCEVTVTPTFFALAESANMTIIGKLTYRIKIQSH